MFCPWNSVRDVQERPPGGSQLYEDQEVARLPYEESEEVLKRFRPTSAWNLERVVAVAQKLTVDGITVAISSLELTVEVTRLVPDPYEEGERAGDGISYEGPWTFRFSL